MLAVVLVYQRREQPADAEIQGKATNISASLVIMSVTLFGALLGVLGALVAVPLTASLQIVVQELTAARRERVGPILEEELEPVAEPAVPAKEAST